MIYSTIQNTPSLNSSSQPIFCTEQVETCHTLLLRFNSPLPVLKIPAYPFDRTRQQHSPKFLITPHKRWTVYFIHCIRYLMVLVNVIPVIITEYTISYTEVRYLVKRFGIQFSVLY